jgi:hypothetical protein
LTCAGRSIVVGTHALAEPRTALGVIFETLDQEGLVGVARFESLESARGAILPLGGAVEVIAPEALRKSVADFAGQTVAVYQRLEV